uniref:Uncharacterized protein n=1 Tax=viral metagenome TaxID=1070528 RepID=A0A6C0KD56_9ZZZZ
MDKSSSIKDFLPAPTCESVHERNTTVNTMMEQGGTIDTITSNPNTTQDFTQGMPAKGFELSGLTKYFKDDSLKLMGICIAVITVMQISTVRNTLMGMAPMILKSRALTVNITIAVISTVIIMVLKNVIN